MQGSSDECAVPERPIYRRFALGYVVFLTALLAVAATSPRRDRPPSHLARAESVAAVIP